jgi:hypothetical protein
MQKDASAGVRASPAIGDKRVSDEAPRNDRIRHQPPPDRAERNGDGGDRDVGVRRCL